LNKQKIIFATILFALLLTHQSFSIIIRDDVNDSKYIELGKKYSDIICHFPMGEGTLIDSSWVITAGHVGKDLKRDLQNGKTTTVKINGTEYEIEDVFVNPNFQPIVNDLALVKLKSKVASNRYVKLNVDTAEIGKRITIIGMGDVGTGLTGPQKWDKITRGATNKIDGADKNWIWFTFDAPNSNKVTEMEGISGPGDSGGPALVEKDNALYIVGISSNQEGKGLKKGTYGVMEYYTRVSSYYSWLLKTMKQPPVSKNTIAKSNTNENNPNEKLKQYTGSYGFRKIILRDKNLFFQRDNEPLIPMKEIGKDLFLWDDESTKIEFKRNKSNAIVGFEIQRNNGEVVKVNKDN
jgi:hypothetical protein